MLKSKKTFFIEKENDIWAIISNFFENKRYHTWNYHLKNKFDKKYLKLH